MFNIPRIGEMVHFWQAATGYPVAAMVVASKPGTERITLRLFGADIGFGERMVEGVRHEMGDVQISRRISPAAVEREDAVGCWRPLAVAAGDGIEAAGDYKGLRYRPGDIVPQSGRYVAVGKKSSKD